MIRPLVILLLLLQLAYAKDSISHPKLDFDDFGGKLSLLGSFRSISYYSYVNESSAFSIDPASDTSSNNTDSKLFIRDLKDDTTKEFADVNGQITSVQTLSDSTILVNGDFTKFNDKDCQTPIIYNITSEEITNIFSPGSTNSKREDLPSLDGEVKTTFVDNDIIYIGGDFSYNESYGAITYNQTSKTITQLPFKGFGESAIVNAITKITNDDEDEDLGSIIFGGKFDTLGIPDLLKHNLSLLENSTNHTNSTNTSLISAEQTITLKHGIFTDVNGDGSDPASLICPENNPTWAPQDNSGGQWLVELPVQMQGINPTKVRLYVPEGDDSIDLFRIYSYPNNGIMNLSYIDPETNEIKYCDAWCPLATLDQLTSATESNLDDIDNLSADDDVYVDENDGSYSTYYDPDTRTKTLSYAAGFQEFSFEDQVGISQVGLTVISWHGSKGAVAGFELYLNAINVYGNHTLNEPNCGEDPNKSNLLEVNSGDFNSIQSIRSSVTDLNYQVAVGTDSKVTMYPNISYSGDYSIIMITPGCVEDQSCDLRSIVNVTLYDTEDNMLEQKTIYQNNDYQKFDYLFYGHLEGSTLSDGQNRIEIEYVDPIIPNTNDPWMVIDRIQADIVELDNYYDMNSTNRTKHGNSTDYGVVELKLSGLFEYSLSNFSYFDEALIHIDGDEDTISPNSTFVGNSSINVLSSHLSNDSVIEEFNMGDDSLMVLGNFSSSFENLTLPNSNIINLKIQDYNSTSNSSVVDIARREYVLDPLDLAIDFEGLDMFDIDLDTIQFMKRDDEEVFGLTFNNTVTTIANYYGSNVLLGRFSVSNENNDSISIYDLSSDNDSVTDANNFVIRSGDEFYSFGNDYIDETFDSFTNVTVKDTEYFVFSAGSVSHTWDNTKKEWITNPDSQLNITQAVNLPNNQQIISGSSFNIMDDMIFDQAFIQSNKDIENEQVNSYNLSLDLDSSITIAYYINESVSVIGGNFNDGEDVANVGFLNTKKNNLLTGLNGKMDFENITIQSLYVDSGSEYLIVGYNGTVSLDDQDLSGGIIIYNLKNNSFTDFQPAELAVSSDDSSLEINSIALLNDQDKLLVGGKFDSAGSLDCNNLCIYDIKNTRWVSPSSDLKGNEVNSISFFQANRVLLSGDMELDGNKVKFAIYDVDKDNFESVDTLNGLSDNEVATHLLMCDDRYNDKLDGRFIAAGDGFISGFDGDNWKSISGINFDNSSSITDMKLLTLKDSNYKGHNDDETFFRKHNILAVSGQLDLEDYGLVNLALYDGTEWIPFIYSGITTSKLGKINSILVEDQFRFLSQEDIKSKSSNLSSGQVVGISLACALGSTILLSLLYIIPYFVLFRKNKDDHSSERIGEKEMTDAVNPQELFHEIDLQRNH